MAPIVGISGSRGFPTLDFVEDWIDKLAAKYPNAVVVSGGARGVDNVAERTAQRAGLDVISFRPYSYENMEGAKEWSIETLTHGERAQELVVEAKRRISPPFFKSFAGAAFHRNGWIVEHADYVVAFHDGKSRGTADTIKRAEKADKLARVFTNEEIVWRALRDTFPDVREIDPEQERQHRLRWSLRDPEPEAETWGLDPSWKELEERDQPRHEQLRL